jgi:hypothetical protein
VCARRRPRSASSRAVPASFACRPRHRRRGSDRRHGVSSRRPTGSSASRADLARAVCRLPRARRRHRARRCRRLAGGCPQPLCRARVRSTDSSLAAEPAVTAREARRRRRGGGAGLPCVARDVRGELLDALVRRLGLVCPRRSAAWPAAARSSAASPAILAPPGPRGGSRPHRRERPPPRRGPRRRGARWPASSSSRAPQRVGLAAQRGDLVADQVRTASGPSVSSAATPSGPGATRARAPDPRTGRTSPCAASPPSARTWSIAARRSPVSRRRAAASASVRVLLGFQRCESRRDANGFLGGLRSGSAHGVDSGAGPVEAGALLVRGTRERFYAPVVVGAAGSGNLMLSHDAVEPAPEVLGAVLHVADALERGGDLARTLSASRWDSEVSCSVAGGARPARPSRRAARPGVGVSGPLAGEPVELVAQLRDAGAFVSSRSRRARRSPARRARRPAPRVARRRRGRRIRRRPPGS